MLFYVTNKVQIFTSPPATDSCGPERRQLAYLFYYAITVSPACA